MEELPAKWFRPFPQRVDVLNEERTREVEQDPVQQRYVAWLHDNGVIFPKVRYPCVFGDGLIGVGAKEDIEPMTAIMFVPMRACLSLSYALGTELKRVFDLYPELFKYHKDALDYMLFITLLYERLKGPNSFWAPFLATIPSPEMALDWSLAELQETHDPLLVHEVRSTQAKQMQFDEAKKWLEVKEVVETHPDVFGVHR